MDRRSEGRHSTALQGFCELTSGGRHHVMITNLSCAGCGLTGELGAAVGDEVRLWVAGLGPLMASVKWVRDGRVGIALAEALEPEVVSYLAACCPRAA